MHIKLWLCFHQKVLKYPKFFFFFQSEHSSNGGRFSIQHLVYPQTQFQPKQLYFLEQISIIHFSLFSKFQQAQISEIHSYPSNWFPQNHLSDKKKLELKKSRSMNIFNNFLSADLTSNSTSTSFKYATNYLRAISCSYNV